MSLTISRRRLLRGGLLGGVVVFLAIAVLAGVAALPPSAPARVDVRVAADWIELGFMSALNCHGGFLPPGEAGDQEYRAGRTWQGNASRDFEDVRAR